MGITCTISASSWALFGNGTVGHATPRASSRRATNKGLCAKRLACHLGICAPLLLDTKRATQTAWMDGKGLNGIIRAQAFIVITDTPYLQLSCMNGISACFQFTSRLNPFISLLSPCSDIESYDDTPSPTPTQTCQFPTNPLFCDAYIVGG